MLVPRETRTCSYRKVSAGAGILEGIQSREVSIGIIVVQ